MGVRFIHTADAHLGSPLNGLGAESDELQATLQEATYDAFRRVVDVAIEAAVDFVVIAGDLYDRESRSVRANQFAAEQFERLADAGIAVYLTYGNHDPVGEGVEFVDLPANVHEFPAEASDSVVHESDGTPVACLCGQSYRRKAESRKFHTDYAPTAPDLPTIGILHTELDSDSNRYAPCETSELLDRDEFDYWALGHIHQPRVHHRDPTIAYPGIPQGRQITETGARGAYLVDLADDGSADLEFVPTGEVIWQRETVTIAGADGEEPPETLPELRERVEEHLWDLTARPEPAVDELSVRSDGWTPTGIMCRCVLSGRGPAHELLDEDEESVEILQSELRKTFDRRTPFVWTEAVRVRTAPELPPIDELRDEDPVFERFDETVTEFHEDDALRDELVEDAIGSVCRWDDGDEESRPARVELTPADLDRLIDRAADLVIDELRTRRAD